MEWTKEQREQAADQLNRIGWSPEYWDSYHPERREREIASVVTGSGVLIPAHKLVDTFCKLTAALSENERLRSQLAKDDTQMGELAVGGAEQIIALVWEMPFSKRYRIYRAVKDMVICSAPPSGEQAANEVQAPKGEV